ncbi:MAG: RecX family transcriptional regulator, partial [bacterium]|nr:RecX family transcriptional regulator [bacterium]
REIVMLLGQKGLRGELVDNIVEEMYAEESELSTIKEIMRKKRWNPSEMEEKEKQKMLAYLMRKGFSYEEIRRAL